MGKHPIIGLLACLLFQCFSTLCVDLSMLSEQGNMELVVRREGYLQGALDLYVVSCIVSL